MTGSRALRKRQQPCLPACRHSLRGSSPRPAREPCVALTTVWVRSQEPGRHSEGRVCLVRTARGGALPVRRGHTSLQARPLTPATQRPLRVLEEASA